VGEDSGVLLSSSSSSSSISRDLCQMIKIVERLPRGAAFSGGEYVQSLLGGAMMGFSGCVFVKTGKVSVAVAMSKRSQNRLSWKVFVCETK